jgi:hypothetical protein
MAGMPVMREDNNAPAVLSPRCTPRAAGRRAEGKLPAMKIGVFLHGTAIMHAAAAGVERDERVRQVRRRDPSVPDYASYLPTPGTAGKLAAWQRQGAILVYLSSHRRPEDIRADESVICRRGLPAGPVYGRRQGEDYGPLVERLGLDVLVEDDCESIGGAAQTCASQLGPAGSRSVRCIVLPEFSGLTDLPDNPAQLLTWAPEK